MSWDDVPTWANSVAESLLTAVRQKDEFTFSHCLRVGRAARRLALAMGLNEFEQAVLEFSGLFHDIGKVGVPESVLLKPGKLDPSEVELMKAHANHSAKILEPFSQTPFFRFLLPGVRYHHERIDGVGYPFGLSGERIPLPARILAVVDTVDAMSFNRPYRTALPKERVLQELKDHSGSQFDAHIVKIYLDSLPFVEKNPNQGVEEELVIQQLFKAS